MSYLLGIDVGTTRTAAAVGRLDARTADPEIVELGDGPERSALLWPSVLFLGDDGTVLAGEAAERRAASDPEHVARDFKRRIGDPTPVVVAGRPWAPEELTARLVRRVVDRVADLEGGPATRIAVTHPASWGGHRTDRLGGALAAHGLHVTFLAEPHAAVLQYAGSERIEPGATVAVYDLGGGTFDAAVLRETGWNDRGAPDVAARGRRGFVLAGRPEGLARLGGIDVDELVFSHVRAELPEAFDGLDETDPSVLAALAAVRRECHEGKEALSSAAEVSVPVLTPAGSGSVRLRRSEFEDLIRPLVEETVVALRRAVASAGLAPDQVSVVLMVGGSSAIPLVGELVSERLGRTVVVDTDPKNAVAQGAVRFLHLLAPAAAPVRVPAPRPAPAARRPAIAGAGVGGAVGGSTALAGGRGFGPEDTSPPTDAVEPVDAGGGAGGGLELPAQRGASTGDTPLPPYPVYPELPRGPVAARRSGRSPEVLVSLGGGIAAAAVVATLFLWPTPTPVATVGVSTPAPIVITTPPTSAVPVESTTAATSETPSPEPRTTSRRATPRRAPVVVPPTTTPAPPTSGDPSTTTTPPTSSESSGTETTSSESSPESSSETKKDD